MAYLLCNVHQLAGNLSVLRIGTVELEVQTAAARVESQSQPQPDKGQTLLQALHVTTPSMTCQTCQGLIQNHFLAKWTAVLVAASVLHCTALRCAVLCCAVLWLLGQSKHLVA